MSRGVSPQSMTYELNKSSRTTYKNTIIDQDMLSQLKVQVFELDQGRRNYENLLAKFHKLQEDIDNIIKVKNQHEISLRQQESDESNLLIADLKAKNENLFNELNEKIALNKKLYNENNALFRELESRKKENKCLQDEICKQEEILRNLTYEKDSIEKKVFNLSKIKEKQELDLINFKEEINQLNFKNDDQNNMIKNRSGQNINIYNQLNEEKILNKNLIFELRDKESNVMNNQQKLNVLNENINRLQSEVDNLTNCINKNNNDISVINDNLINETNALNQLISDNSNMNNDIHDREIQIKNITNENETLKQDNKILNDDANKINNIVEIYKKHLILLVIQNKKIAAEIQLLIGRDAEIKTILERINYLKDISEENDREVTNSIERIKPHIDDNNFECSSNNISMRRTYSFEGSEIRNDDMNSNYRYEPKIDNLNEKENVLNISQSRNLKKENEINISTENIINEQNISRNIDINMEGNN
jgi:hypothetical protein